MPALCRMTLVALISCVGIFSEAYAQPAAGKRPPKGYFYDDAGCLRRTPASVLKNLPVMNCSRQPAKRPDAPVPVYTTATPAQVIAALDCDFAAAAKATKGKRMDLSKAVVSGSVKFSLVTKTSAGGSLSVAAIPVFSAASIAPSLEASRLSETTESNEFSITIDPAAVVACQNPSSNMWLTSRVVLDDAHSGGFRIEKFETKISFVVTRQQGAGFKLNIVPVSIGPQFSSSNVNTQSLSLLFDFTKKPAAPGTPATMPVSAPVSR